jgi:YVTN family beta-propeller protein
MMSTAQLVLIALALVSPAIAQNATTDTSIAQGQPLRLVGTFSLPSLGSGNFDHFAVDLKRQRLFATPEEASEVLVLDVQSGEVIREIKSIKRPHAILYRSDIDRLYVTDGVDGAVLVLDGRDYQQIARIPVLKDADAIGYDISKKALYVDNGGKDVGEKFSHVSVIDTSTNKVIQDIQVQGETLEAMALDSYRPRAYVNDTAKNSIVVINRYTHAQVAEWPIKKCTSNVSMALDEQRQRLFVGCRSGQIVVMDSNTGAELQELSIHSGVDDVIYDAATKRIYASTDGFMDVFSQTDLNHYSSLGSVATGAKGRTAKLVSEMNRLFVAVPKDASTPARVLAFEPINTPPAPPAKNEVKEIVSAPAALEIVLQELTKHPTLRRIGLHAIPPGQKAMVIIANANETRIGVHTSQGDFDAVKEGKTYGPHIADGEFYNIKMPMLDAKGKKIGILVMEIPSTDVANEQEAAREAEAIRSEIAAKIKDEASLFAAYREN